MLKHDVAIKAAIGNFQPHATTCCDAAAADAKGLLSDKVPVARHAVNVGDKIVVRRIMMRRNGNTWYGGVFM
jgi:hypothetical protein